MDIEMKVRAAIGKRIFPKSTWGDGSLVAEMWRNDERIANDPEIQRRRQAARDIENRKRLPVVFGSIVLNAALWITAAWHLPNVVTPTFAIAAFAGSSWIFWRITRG